MNIKKLLAKRTCQISGNAIREILKVTAKPEIISLAGGLPAPETFPVGTLNRLHKIVYKKYGPVIYQYGVTEGFQPFRQALANYVKRRGISATFEQVFITSGSQGALDAIGKVFINPGDVVVVEAPTYLGAMSAFNPYQPKYIEVNTDDEGILPDELEKLLRHQRIKLIYLNPTFQNPTGKTLGLTRRKTIANLLKQYQVLAVEDDPYSELRYRGEPLPSIKSFAPDNVIYLSTLSKIFVPGFRLGFIITSQSIGKWLTFAKQGADLHSSSYGQALASEYLANHYLEKHLPEIIRLYKPRQESMLNALDRYMPPGFFWTRPDGGMFIWVEGKRKIDYEKVYWLAVENKVAFVPGKFFFANPKKGKSTLRLNFTNSDEATLDKAVKLLAQVFSKFS